MTKLGSGLVKLALAVGLLTPLVLLVSAVLTKIGVLDWRLGYSKIALAWTPILSMVGVGLGLAAVVLAFFVLRQARLSALVALLAPAATLIGLTLYDAKVTAEPPVHDVATTWEDPIMLSRTFAAERGPGDNPVEENPLIPASVGGSWAGKRVAEANAAACPGARTIPTLVDADKVQAAIEKMGGRVYGKQVFRVEAVFDTFWFGFTDDVAIRIRPGETDIRSISREGQADGGRNCRRVTALVQALSW